MSEHLTVYTIGGEWRTARKEHECQCGLPIKVGERYSRDVQMVEGSIEVTKVANHIHSHELEQAAYDAWENDGRGDW